MSARARIHAMFPLDASGEHELNARLDAHRVEVLDEGITALRKWADMDVAIGVLLSVRDDRDTADEAVDFFRPGRTYTEDAPFRAPEDRPNFQCIAVAVHPTTGGRRALGFEQAGAGRPWKSSSLRDEEWADGWVDVTEAGAE